MPHANAPIRIILQTYVLMVLRVVASVGILGQKLGRLIGTGEPASMIVGYAKGYRHPVSVQGGTNGRQCLRQVNAMPYRDK